MIFLFFIFDSWKNSLLGYGLSGSSPVSYTTRYPVLSYMGTVALLLHMYP